MTAEEQCSETYCHYLPIRINNTSCAAFVDSGNTWRTAISAQFARELGLTAADIQPTDRKSVGTAKTDSSLPIIGETKKPLYINMNGMETRFRVRPIIIEGLAMSVNLSGPFLKAYKIDPSTFEVSKKKAKKARLMQEKAAQKP